MKKKILISLFFATVTLLVGLQSCNVNNNNPTVPLPIHTNTPTGTPTSTPTATSTPTSTTTPVACATHVVLSEAAGVSTIIGANYTYVDQFTLGTQSDFNSVTVTIAGASVTGPGDNLQIALYSDNSGYPGQVFFTSSPRAFSTTGPATYIFNPPGSFSLLGQNYWLAPHSSVQYQPYQNSPSATKNYLVTGHFPDPFPTPGGASIPGLPWSYNMYTCHP
jgi:hypothetical protein